MVLTQNLGGSNLGGGKFNGVSVRQTRTSTRDSEFATTRHILRSSWNGNGAAGVYGDNDRVITPFRAVMNMGDFLSRKNYVCGGAAEVQASKPGRVRLLGFIRNVCDSTGVPAGACNSKFVADSSLYTRFRKERAVNQNYNDNGYDGFINDAFIPIMRVRHHR